jgi:hypothetical protein
LLAVLAIAGVIGSLFGPVLSWARHRKRRESDAATVHGPADLQLAGAAALTTLAAVAVVLCSDLYEFSWRCQLPALVTLPLAGVFGGMVIAGRLRRYQEQTVPLRDTDRRSRYWLTLVSTHELPERYAVWPSPLRPSSTPEARSLASACAQR